jgi:hypothetical protein
VAGGKSVFVDPLLLGLAGAPADAVYANSQGSWYAAAADALPKWKGKTSGGVVVNFTPVQSSDLSAYVAKSLYDANTILAATTDDTPAALTVGASTIVGRKSSGGIAALTASEVRTVLDVPTNAEAILDTIVDAKGDLIAGTAADTVARLAVGVNGQVLVSDSAQSAGLAWGDPGGMYNPAYQTLVAEAFPYRSIMTNPGNLRPTSGRLEGIKIPVPKTITVTNILLSVNQVGGTLTSGQNKVGLYDSSGTKLGETADQSTTWLSTGEPTTMAISGGPIVIPGGPGVYIYACILSVGTTPVGLRAMHAAASTFYNLPNVAAAYWNAILGGLTGQTSLPASITLSSNGLSNAWHWVGLS